jgi:hypothetical protein
MRVGLAHRDRQERLPGAAPDAHPPRDRLGQRTGPGGAPRACRGRSISGGRRPQRGARLAPRTPTSRAAPARVAGSAPERDRATPRREHERDLCAPRPRPEGGRLAADLRRAPAGARHRPRLSAPPAEGAPRGGSGDCRSDRGGDRSGRRGGCHGRPGRHASPSFANPACCPCSRSRVRTTCCAGRHSGRRVTAEGGGAGSAGAASLGRPRHEARRAESAPARSDTVADSVSTRCDSRSHRSADGCSGGWLDAHIGSSGAGPGEHATRTVPGSRIAAAAGIEPGSATSRDGRSGTRGLERDLNRDERRSARAFHGYVARSTPGSAGAAASGAGGWAPALASAVCAHVLGRSKWAVKDSNLRPWD